jgi:hypothetical protein
MIEMNLILIFQLLRLRDYFRQEIAPKLPTYRKGYIEVDFATSLSLAHALELVCYHGLRSFYIYLQGEQLSIPYSIV